MSNFTKCNFQGMSLMIKGEYINISHLMKLHGVEYNDIDIDDDIFDICKKEAKIKEPQIKVKSSEFKGIYIHYSILHFYAHALPNDISIKLFIFIHKAIQQSVFDESSAYESIEEEEPESEKESEKAKEIKDVEKTKEVEKAVKPENDVKKDMMYICVCDDKYTVSKKKADKVIFSMEAKDNFWLMFKEKYGTKSKLKYIKQHYSTFTLNGIDEAKLISILESFNL